MTHRRRWQVKASISRWLAGSDSERGQAVVLMALVAGVLLLTIGLAVDAGSLYVSRRTQQAAADAAAWAGAVELYYKRSASEARDTAIGDAFRNGFSTNAEVTVIANVPPVTGPHAGDPQFIEVIIERQVRTTFLQGAGGVFTLVRARAVGGAMPFQSSHAIMALDRDGQTFKTNGNGGVRANGGGIKINSGASDAGAAVGNGGVYAPYIHVGGGVSTSGGSATFSPTPVRGLPPDADPFFTMPGPPIDGLPTFRNVRVNGAETLDPGVYVGGITITSSGNAKLRPGLYVFKGGGIKITGGGVMEGVTPDTGVLLFNTHNNYPGAAGTCGDIALAGNGKLDLRAQQFGPYAGILLWQDRACTEDLAISGNGTLTTLVGTVYAPTAHINLTGNGSTALTLDAQFISSLMDYAGNAALNLNWINTKVGRPILPTLVE
jgi:hypothetical protein